MLPLDKALQTIRQVGQHGGRRDFTRQALLNALAASPHPTLVSNEQAWFIYRELWGWSQRLQPKPHQKVG